MSEMEQRQRRHVFFTWSSQENAKGLEIVRAEGSRFWTVEGKDWLDFESQVYNAHLGHGNSRVIRAIQEQAESLAVAHPAAVFPAKMRLGERLAEVTPEGITKFFFTLGGAEANENAVKIARMVTGRHKIISRYNSYHGATYGALTLTGDRRRIPFEPGIPGVVRAEPPDCFRCPWGETPTHCNVPCATSLTRMAEWEDPSTVAAILVEPIGGAVGGYMPPPAYMQHLRSFCDEHGILLIADEVLTGFGRTGRWFAIDHSGVQPDMLVMAKGLTAGYAPMGAVGVSEAIASYFETQPLVAGLTCYGHPLSCAAALATVEELIEENWVDRAQETGSILKDWCSRMETQFKQIGQARSMGLYGVVEFCAADNPRKPLVAEGEAGEKGSPLVKFREALRTAGVHMAVKGPRAFIAPPLTISEAELHDGLKRVEEALSASLTPSTENRK